jgi:hypothetical protein
MRPLARPSPLVQCDLCDRAMTTDHLVQHEDGTWRGLLVCTQCIEDEADARADTARVEMGLVGGGL